MMHISPDNVENVTPYQKFLREVSTAISNVLPEPEYMLACNVLPQHHTAG